MKTKFNYEQAFKRKSRHHKVWEYPVKPSGERDWDSGMYVNKPEAFEFALPWRPKLGIFKYKARSECTFNPYTGDAHSYGHWKFVWKVRNTYIFNTHSYSNTTSSHQSSVSLLLKQLGIKNVVRLDLGRDRSLDVLYYRLFSLQAEQKRPNAKSRADQIKSIMKDIAIGRKLGLKTYNPVNDIKNRVTNTENVRTANMLEAKTERKRLRDLVKTIADSKPEDLSSQDMIKETNSEVRRMLFNKIGGERVLRELGAQVLDKNGNYELVNLSLESNGGWNQRRPFLKMLNPSTGETHVEGVPPTTTTVNEALAWRNGLNTWQQPLKLT